MAAVTPKRKQKRGGERLCYEGEGVQKRRKKEQDSEEEKVITTLVSISELQEASTHLSTL